MDELMQWLGANKEWIFSGIGVAIVVWMARIMIPGRKAASSQEIRSGSDSRNIQAGRDIRIKSNSTKSNVEEE